MEQAKSRLAHVRNLLIDALGQVDDLVLHAQHAEQAAAAQALLGRDTEPELDAVPPPLPTEQRMNEYFREVLEAVNRALAAGQPVAAPVYVDPEMIRAYHHYAAQRIVVNLASGAVTLAVPPDGYARSTSIDAEVLRGATARPGFVTPD
jgi:hypothetical protein